MRPTLLFLPPQDDRSRAWAAGIAKTFPEISVVVAEDDATADRAIGSADAAFGTLKPEWLAKAGKLRWLQAPMAAPPAGYYSPALIAHPTDVTNFRGIFNEHIATHVMAYVLTFARGLHLTMHEQFNGRWHRVPPGEHPMVHLPATTMLIVGVGGVGGELARLAAAFGINVIGIDARRPDIPEGLNAMYPPEKLDEMLPTADWVVLTVPHTPATEGYFNRARFRRMKRSGWFINIGRGMTTRLDDLVAALDAGEIAGAALDVFEQEPLPASHPLWRMPNVLLTPHLAFEGPYLDDRRYEIIADNCRAFLAGTPLRNLVDKAAWF